VEVTPSASIVTKQTRVGFVAFEWRGVCTIPGGGKGMELHIDPVCAMKISDEETVGTSEYEGNTYHFCSFGCKEQFDADPYKFVHGSERHRTGREAA
jgi:YHS domain-containing protein